ncbi:hypothetical protein DRN76_03265, partial [Methanosarcinales archaeon]
IRNIINKLTRNMIKTDRFRLTEAIAYSWRIDVWQRYSGIAEKIKMMGRDCGVTYPSRFNTKAKVNELNSCPVVANACDLPFHDSVFDCVVATEIIEHLYNPSIFIEGIKKVLKDEGAMLLSTLNRDGINFNEIPKYASIKHTSHKKHLLLAELWSEREMRGYTGTPHVFELFLNHMHNKW